MKVLFLLRSPAILSGLVTVALASVVIGTDIAKADAGRGDRGFGYGYGYGWPPGLDDDFIPPGLRDDFVPPGLRDDFVPPGLRGGDDDRPGSRRGIPDFVRDLVPDHVRGIIDSILGRGRGPGR